MNILPLILFLSACFAFYFIGLMCVIYRDNQEDKYGRHIRVYDSFAGPILCDCHDGNRVKREVLTPEELYQLKYTHDDDYIVIASDDSMYIFDNKSEAELFHINNNDTKIYRFAKTKFNIPKGWERVNPDDYRVKSYERIM